MSNVAIQIEGISKRYQLGASTGDKTFREMITGAVSGAAKRLLPRKKDQSAEPDEREFWALRDVGFTVKHGDVVGLIGRNGAGKSTLLKILSQITDPTEGRAEIFGRVGSLLEVGTGFHPELTGRENAFLNGAILGMSHAEVKRKFDEIVAFAEIEKFIDTPVKRYSSGMYVRLAFAVAAHLEPEILIVDEVLAVGDASFQKKCIGKMQDVAGHGRTVVFVSHNMSAVQSLCNRAVVLSKGTSIFEGDVDPAIDAYMEHVTDMSKVSLDEHPDRKSTGELKYTAVRAFDETETERSEFVAGKPMTFEFEYERNEPCTSVSFGFTVYNHRSVACTHMNTGNHKIEFEKIPQRGVIRCHVPRNPFPIGEYHITVAANANGRTVDLIPACYTFSVVTSQFFEGIRPINSQFCPVMVDHAWNTDR